MTQAKPPCPFEQEMKPQLGLHQTLRLHNFKACSSQRFTQIFSFKNIPTNIPIAAAFPVSKYLWNQVLRQQKYVAKMTPLVIQFLCSLLLQKYAFRGVQWMGMCSLCGQCWIMVISVQGWSVEPAAPGSRNCGLVPRLDIPSTTGSCPRTEGLSMLLQYRSMVPRRSLVFNLILVSAPVLNMECNYHNITNWQNDNCRWKCGFFV